MKIAVTGKHGQVVQSLIELAPARGHTIVLLGRPEIDLAAFDTARATVLAAGVDAIVSAAAYTAVDKAETDRDMAFAVNTTGAGAVAAVAASLGVPLVHLSTDFVFDGSNTEPYVETDPTGPLGVYGESKLAGEQAVLAAHPDSAVLRTAWVYSPFGGNFVKTMLRLAGDRDELGVVADQVGNPTSALDIAAGILSVAERLATDRDPALRGVFNMTAEGATSWAGFAEAIFAASSRHGGPTARVRSISTSDYPTPARRPGNSQLDCDKLAALHGVRLPHWIPSLDLIVGRLLA